VTACRLRDWVSLLARDRWGMKITTLLPGAIHSENMFINFLYRLNIQKVVFNIKSKSTEVVR